MMSAKVFIASLIFFVVVVDLQSVIVNGDELFTAQVELESLLASQENVVEAVERYLAKERSRLEGVEKMLLPLVERGKKVPFEVVSNPLSAFLLVKGLTVDLDDLLTLSASKSNTEELASTIKELKNSSRFPTSEDLNGAAVAIHRLQDTYLLDTADMAKGEVLGRCCTWKLSVDDLFELGRQSYNAGDHDHTILWMTEALAQAEENRHNMSLRGDFGVKRAEILEYLAFSTYQKGEMLKAISLTKQLLTLEPDHPRAKGNIGHYERIMDERKGEDGRLTDQTLTIKERRVDEVGWEKAKYEALCRGETLPNYSPRFRCRLVRKGSPYLLIAPVKQELVHAKPDIFIYHNVISDREIEVVQRLAQPRLKRATVHNHNTGELVTAQYRISKSAWLQAEEHPVVDAINKRITDVTGLAMETAEELQVVNYGLGGHYEPHYDFARRDEKDAFKSLGTGNRIATFLFYMSDVEAGGATVFPSLNLALWPTKGSAAFWYNLYEDGVGDLSTRHAGCPVLLGSKWVSNKWIHERGQEFARPCKLKPSEQSPNAD